MLTRLLLRHLSLLWSLIEFACSAVSRSSRRRIAHRRISAAPARHHWCAVEGMHTTACAASSNARCLNVASHTSRRVLHCDRSCRWTSNSDDEVAGRPGRLSRSGRPDIFRGPLSHPAGGPFMMEVVVDCISDLLPLCRNVSTGGCRGVIKKRTWRARILCRGLLTNLHKLGGADCPHFCERLAVEIRVEVVDFDGRFLLAAVRHGLGFGLVIEDERAQHGEGVDLAFDCSPRFADALTDVAGLGVTAVGDVEQDFPPQWGDGIAGAAEGELHPLLARQPDGDAAADDLGELLGKPGWHFGRMG